MPIRLICALFLCTQAPAAARTAAAGGAIESKQAEASRLMDELSPKLQRLKALQGSYLDRGVFPKLAAEHEQLTDEITALNYRLDKTVGQLIAMRNSGETIDVVNFIAKISKHEKVDTAAAGLKFADFRSRTAFETEIIKLTGNTFTLLATDKAAFQDAEGAHLRQRLMSRVTSALLILLILAVAFGAWRKRGRILQTMSLGPSRALCAGTILKDNYRIDSRLGEGALGVLYEAVDLALQRQVALKQLREELFCDEKALENFLAQTRLLAGLRYPNIVEIYAAFEDAGRVFLVYEFARGRSLRSLLTGRPFSLRGAKSVARQIASSLDYAFSFNLLHRDLKPSNVMLTPEARVKVTDFGAASPTRTGWTRLVRRWASDGLPYEAPELAGSPGAHSRESDMYSLGVILYEMLAGRLPSSNSEAAAGKKDLRLTALSAIAPGLPAALDGVIGKALAPDPMARFRSGAELVCALEALPS